MHAVVLVGGFGTRLRPVSRDVPKPLLPIAHRSMLERLVQSLGRAGVTDVTLALGFNPDPFLAAFPDATCLGVRLHFAVEPTPLDTAGAIGFAARRSGVTGTFIVANGDVITTLDVASLVEFHRARRARATISLTPVEDPSQYGIVETDADGRVLAFHEKPSPDVTSSRDASGGTYVFEESCLDLMPGDAPLSVERVVFPALATNGELYARSTDDYWIDAGRPETYLAANLDAVRREGVAAVHPASGVDATAIIDDSVVEAAAIVGAGATVRRCVLLGGASVAAGAVVEDSIVLGRIGSGARVRGSVVGASGVVPEGATIDDARVPGD